MTLTSTVKLAEVTCLTCGIDFYIPDNLAVMRINTEDDIYCPNGHAHTYHWVTDRKKQDDSEKTKAENERLKRELFQALHDREQAEARGLSPDLQEPAAAPAPAPESPRSPQCPICGKRYKLFGRNMRSHLTYVHKLTSESAANKMDEAFQQWNATGKTMQT